MKIHLSTATAESLCIELYEPAMGRVNIIFDEPEKLAFFIDAMQGVMSTGCWADINNRGRLLEVTPIELEKPFPDEQTGQPR